MAQHHLTRPHQQQQQHRDDTTRYLCAATQLDPDFADKAIKEFLVEPTRSVPPSPGTDTVAVLGEAVASRARRKYRDALLLVMAVILVVIAPMTMTIAWIVVGVLAKVPALASPKKVSAATKNALTVVVAIAAVVVVVLLLRSPELSSSTGYSSGLDSTGSDVGLVFTIVLLAGVLTVFLTDRIIVWQHLVTRFSRTSPPVANPLAATRAVSANSTFMDGLRRVDLAERQRRDQTGVPLVVHRGYSPFVGAGFPYKPWSIAVPLQVVPGKTTKELSTDVFYERITAALTDMGRATPLTPGKRLGEMRVTGQVLVPADELIDHIANPNTRAILADLDYAPAQTLPAEEAGRLRANPDEWARYYLCLQVETWDRDLVISVFIHAAMDENTLYVEWTPCVLLPIKPGYQEIDRMPRSPLRPIMNAVLETIRLPASLIPNTIRLFSFIRPLPRDDGMVDARMYGSLNSLREMAADDDVQNYFQITDIERYLKILNSRYTLTVAKLLQESGYSTANFNQQAQSVSNKYIHIERSVVHGNVNTGDNVQQGDVTEEAQ